MANPLVDMVRVFSLSIPAYGGLTKHRLAMGMTLNIFMR
jgi:hypothetical protein